MRQNPINSTRQEKCYKSMSRNGPGDLYQPKTDGGEEFATALDAGTASECVTPSTPQRSTSTLTASRMRIEISDSPLLKKAKLETPLIKAEVPSPSAATPPEVPSPSAAMPAAEADGSQKTFEEEETDSLADLMDAMEADLTMDMAWWPMRSRAVEPAISARLCRSCSQMWQKRTTKSLILRFTCYYLCLSPVLSLKVIGSTA